MIGGAPVPHDIFISCSRSDKVVADATCAMLESNGLRCWIAPRDIPSGREWPEAIIDAISQAKIMVLIFSESANESVQVKREVERAVHHGIPILPVRLENVLPAKTLEYFISSSHWLDAFPPPAEQYLSHLVKAVRGIVDTASDTTPTRSTLTELVEARQHPERTRLLTIGALAVLIVGILLWHFLGVHALQNGTSVSGSVVGLPAGRRYEEISRIAQPEQHDGAGHVTVEASLIHILRCNSRDRIYIYEYLNRHAFRAIAPPYWGTVLGGRDFDSFVAAAEAGCS